MPHTEVPIKIDKENLKSPTPTTGAALYALGSVGTEYDLYLDIPGQSDDELIPNDAISREIKPGSHFYTVKKTLNPGND